MPLRLKTVLTNHGISQPALAAKVKQKNGVELSKTGLSFIVNRGVFPAATPEDDVRSQIEAALREWGVPEDEIAEIWQPEQPAEAHLAAATAAAAKRAAKTAAKENEVVIEPVENTMLSPAARRHFKLFRDPFQDDVNGPEDVFLDDDQRYIREAMFQTAKHGGFMAAIGESGAGKSVLRRDLIDRIQRDGHPISVVFPQSLDKTKMKTSNICEAIINDLQPGTRLKGRLEGQARQVKEVLIASSRAGNSHVLLIEEAHDLSVQTLKYLKRFWELEDGFKKLLSIVLIGQPELKRILDERINFEAREVIRRIEVAELLPLGENLQAYLEHKLRRAGSDAAQIFAEDTYEGIRARLTATDRGTGRPLSQMYPLVVNNLVTKAMNRAAEISMPIVTGDLVRAL